ncbi:MAG: hypothetical protein ACUVUP_05145 [Thermaceae bacterium]
MKRAFFMLMGLFGWALALSLGEVFDQVDRALSQVRLDPGAMTFLDQAQTALRQGADQVPPVLRDALLANIQEARQALARKSQVDLEARLLIIRHLLGKALYDAFFQAKAQGKPEAGGLLERLKRAVGLPPSLVEEAGRGNDLSALRTRFERWFTDGMALDLKRALEAPSRPEAFLSVTRAYARFLVVQDSPRSTLRAREFVNALTLISTGQPFQPEVQALKSQVADWQKGLQASPSPPQGPQAGPPPAQPTPSQPSAQPTPKASSPPAAPATPPRALALPGGGEPSLLPLNPEVARAVGGRLGELGIESLVDWLAILDDLRSAVAQAQFYISSGQYDRAREQLAYTHERYRLKVYPVVSAYAPDLADRTDQLFLRMQNAVGLRTIDTVVLLGELQEADERLLGGSLGPWQKLQVKMEFLFLGLPRAILALLAAVLSFFPLYLVRLTFGGRNLYWNLVSLAFFFLFLPAFLEGLSYLGAILADYGGLPGLGVLAHLSFAQGLFSYLILGASVFLVVVFATIGLQGIAAQFGLLQSREKAGMAQEKPSPNLTSEGVTEWDEEF